MRFLYLKQWHGVSQLIPYKAESISGKSSAHQYAAVTIREAYEDVTVEPTVYLVIGGRLRHMQVITGQDQTVLEINQ